MMNKIIFLLIVLGAVQISVFAQTTQRFVAVTIDDLPVVSTRKDLKTRQEITGKLLAHITNAKVPAIGFVNETQLFAAEKLDQAQVELLKKWLVAGLELGNHTYSHKSLHGISIEQYETDILRGEVVTKQLLEAKGRRIIYFRHPFLQTGRSLKIKDELNAFLQAHHYRIAPVTIDNSDWIFARAYDNAFDRGDKKMMEQIGAAYVPYLSAKMDYWERQSTRLFNREIKQILLLHANSINADYLGDVLQMIEKRDYQFINLEKALSDEAYKLPDTFVGKGGISWLHRWALAKGEEYVLPNEPLTPAFVMKAAGVDSE